MLVIVALATAGKASGIRMFQIFMDGTGMKALAGDQMNTNPVMLHVLLQLVHTDNPLKCGKNAQKFGKMPPHWAKSGGGLNWY